MNKHECAHYVFMCLLKMCVCGVYKTVCNKNGGWPREAKWCDNQNGVIMMEMKSAWLKVGLRHS